MKKVFKKEVLIGYEIGENISVHWHINDPESWFLTIRPLKIFGERLCKKTSTEEEVARYIFLRLKTDCEAIQSLLNEVHPLT